MQQTHAVFGELAHYRSELFNWLYVLHYLKSGRESWSFFRAWFLEM